MLVKFELEDRDGHFLAENRSQKEMSTEDIMLLLKTDEIFYPLGNGRGAFCTVVHTIYEMAQVPHFIEIHLKEID